MADYSVQSLVIGEEYWIWTNNIATTGILKSFEDYSRVRVYMDYYNSEISMDSDHLCASPTLAILQEIRRERANQTMYDENRDDVIDELYAYLILNHCQEQNGR